jgi:ABC-type Fe3+-hydroxamate transport system substrate-binding protein
MPTPWRTLVVPTLLAIVLTAACGSDNGYSSSPTGAAAAGTTAPGQASSSEPANSAANPPVTGDTAAPRTDDIPGAPNEIIVHVGVDDAATVGSRVETVKLGDHVVLRLTSDTDETYHVNGYNLEQKVAAGVEAQFEFTANQAGDFEVGSHTTQKVYVVLHVS